MNNLKNLSHKTIIFSHKTLWHNQNQKKLFSKTTHSIKKKKEWSNRFAFLYGKKIVGVRYLTQEETEASGWYSSPIVIELSDGSALIPQSDDEGNDGGALWIANSKGKEDLAPVIRG